MDGGPLHSLPEAPDQSHAAAAVTPREKATREGRTPLSLNTIADPVLQFWWWGGLTQGSRERIE